MSAPTAVPAAGAGLRRLGLALAVVWLLAAGITAADAWMRLGEADGLHMATSLVAAALLRTWGWLGAALIVYLAGVAVGTRTQQVPQIRYRPQIVHGIERDKALPIVVVGVVVAALAAAMIRQMLR